MAQTKPDLWERYENPSSEAPSVGSPDPNVNPHKRFDPAKDPFIKAAKINIPKNLPRVVGWRLLIVPFVPPEKVGSLYVPDVVADVNKDVVMAGLVIGMGEDAYQGTDSVGKPRFKMPWCGIGEWVMFAKWSGSRIQIEGCAFRLMNDDEIFAVVPDPSVIMRA